MEIARRNPTATWLGAIEDGLPPLFFGGEAAQMALVQFWLQPEIGEVLTGHL
jgi:hypothetical protein